MGMSCLDCHDYMDGYNRGKKEGTIEELEKIKKEIHDIKLELDCDYYTGDKITRLIEKHIAELKGENNHDCRNCDKWKTCENGEKGHANGTSIGYSIGECRDYAEMKGE